MVEIYGQDRSPSDRIIAMKILLATVHSKYVHSSLALPCLASFCRDIEGIGIVLKEFTLKEARKDALSAIIAQNPDVVAFSCYIWNIDYTLGLVAELKDASPHIFIILGGPEVSHDAVGIMKANGAVDCVVKGEGERTFRDLVVNLNASFKNSPDCFDLEGIADIAFRRNGSIAENAPASLIEELDSIPSPFEARLVDMGKPLIYYESSRGCPFTCAFCLSSLDVKVRSFSMKRVKSDLKIMIGEGAKTIKFVDRTFNYNAKRADEIWNFILENNEGSIFHFEISADLLTEENFALLKKAPEGVFRFEIGVQSVAETALKGVNRQSDLQKLFTNVERLLLETNVTVHLDLVAGLPGEGFSGFLAALEKMLALRPHHIQIEPLKILKGAPMREIAEKEGYLWITSPPYTISRTPWLTPEEIGRIEVTARLIDLIYNSGRFSTSLAVLAGIMPLGEFFAEIAVFWERRGIAILSLDELFETFHAFSANLLAEADIRRYRDALTFDRCMVDYPNPKKLPSYFLKAEEFAADTQGLITEIRKRLNIPADGRVRVFGWQFERNHLSDKGDTGAKLLFVYVSSYGKGQKIFVMERGGIPLPIRQR